MDWKWKSIARRINGISIHGYGINWSPPESHRKIALRVISRLEDRRVLYKRTEYEYPVKCEKSVEDIRRMLTNEIEALEHDTKIASILKAMRAACRQFLDTLQDNQLNVELSAYPYPAKHWEFIDALKCLRDDFGYYVAYLSAIYRIDVESDLAQIMPVARWDRILDPLNISRS